jgi:DUF438 domain-containing protein
MSVKRYELETGALTLIEMKAIFEAWPADVTFVDAENLIRFYTERYRIFRRTPDAIGTDVVDCHSAASRPRVAQLIAELRDGWRDEATFVEEQDGRPVHIRYLPVRDGGEYLGTLEVAQWADEIGV